MLLNRVAFVVKDPACDLSVTGSPSFVKSMFEMMNLGHPFIILAQRV
jgi:hypothetical protein